MEVWGPPLESGADLGKCGGVKRRTPVFYGNRNVGVGWIEEGKYYDS